MPKNYYAVLKVSPDANSATIHSAFRALARQYHPDVGKESSPNKFRELVEAYRMLSDPELRRQYDLELAPIQQSQVAPEPLFGNSRRQASSMRSASSALEEIIAEMFRFLDSGLDVP